MVPQKDTMPLNTTRGIPPLARIGGIPHVKKEGRRDYLLPGKRPGTGASGVTSLKFHAKHGSWCWK